jgi:hypothetical protein
MREGLAAYVSKSKLTPKEIRKNISEFRLDSVSLPPPFANWFRARHTFEQLLSKILEYGPKDQLVLIDYYIGLLLLTRSWVETGRWPTKTGARK